MTILNPFELVAESVTPFQKELQSQLISLDAVFNQQTRVASQMLQNVLQMQTEPDYRSNATYKQKLEDLFKQLNNVYDILSAIKSLQQTYDIRNQQSSNNFVQNNQSLWDSTVQNDNYDTMLQEQQQRFSSVQHLAKQSHELYLHQNIVMWIYITLFILLFFGCIFMYYWMHTSSPSSDHSLSNLPKNKKSILDNDAITHEDLFDDDEEYDEEDDDYEDDNNTKNDTETSKSSQSNKKDNTSMLQDMNPFSSKPRSPEDVSSASEVSSSSSQNRESSLFK